MSNLSLFGPTKRIAEKFAQDAEIVLANSDVNTFVKTLPDKSIALIITSPPYNLGKEYEDRVSIQKYLDAQAHTIEQLCRVLKDDGSLCWQVGNFVENGEVFPLDILYYEIFKRQGLFLRNRIIWHFEHGLHASKRFSGRYETILWFTKSDRYVFNLDSVRVASKYPGKRHYKGPNKGKLSGNPLGKNPSDFWNALADEWEAAVWDIPNVKANHPEKTDHPCQFPVELIERCVLSLTNENDWVLDPYAGVASSLIAAIKTGRRAMGCEKEPHYAEAARERILSYLNGTLPLRSIGKPVHQPSGKEKVAQVPDEWQTSAEARRLLDKPQKYAGKRK